MNVYEVKEKKQHLEEEIEGLITLFEMETGLFISNISMDKKIMESRGKDIVVSLKVNAEVKI